MTNNKWAKFDELLNDSNIILRPYEREAIKHHITTDYISKESLMDLGEHYSAMDKLHTLFHSGRTDEDCAKADCEWDNIEKTISHHFISKEEVREIIESHKGIYDKRIDPIECEEIYKRDNALLQEIIDSLNLK